MSKREYQKRLKEINIALETASGLKYILLMEEKETIEYLILKAV